MDEAVRSALPRSRTYVDPTIGAELQRMRRVAKLVWPRSPSSGGKTNRMLRQVFDALYEFSLTAEDFDVVTGTLHKGALSKARLLTELRYDRDLRLGESREPHDATASGRATGGLRDQSLSWRFADRYVEHARAGGLLALDLERLSALDGVAKTLRVQMSAPRFPFRTLDGDRRLQTCSIELSAGNLTALGILSANPKQQRRTLRAAGSRIVEADNGYRA